MTFDFFDFVLNKTHPGPPITPCVSMLWWLGKTIMQSLHIPITLAATNVFQLNTVDEFTYSVLLMVF